MRPASCRSTITIAHFAVSEERRFEVGRFPDHLANLAMPGSDEDDDVAIAHFDGDGNGGNGSDATEVIKEEEDEAASDPPPPPSTAATVAPFHDEDDHYDNIQVRPPAQKPLIATLLPQKTRIVLWPTSTAASFVECFAIPLGPQTFTVSRTQLICTAFVFSGRE